MSDEDFREAAGKPDELSKEKLEELWLDEAERRSRDWDEGRVQGIPSLDVLSTLKTRG